MTVSTWITIVATGIAVAAALIAWNQAKHAKRSADIAGEVLEIERRRMELEHPAVAWKVEHLGGHLFRLVNKGTVPATGVTVTLDHPDRLMRHLPSGVTIRGDGGVSGRFVITSASGAPRPQSVMVAWDGEDEPVAVPMPAT